MTVKTQFSKAGFFTVLLLRCIMYHSEQALILNLSNNTNNT